MPLTRRRTSYIKKTKKQRKSITQYKTQYKTKYKTQYKTKSKKQKKTQRKNKTIKMYRKKIHGGNYENDVTVDKVDGVAVKFNPIVSSSDGSVRTLEEFKNHQIKLGSGTL